MSDTKKKTAAVPLEQKKEVTENEQITQRKAKLSQWREEGSAYPSGFIREHLAEELLSLYSSDTSETLSSKAIEVTLAGRMMTRRLMGKASFAHIQDMSGQIQLYVARDALPEGHYLAFKQWDIGDILGVKGVLFKTKTDMLSVKVTELVLLTKALRPLPDKYHGLQDQELCYRQRYVDLMVNPETRRVFTMRSRIIAVMRRFFDDQGFMEVETPMMQSMAGGAAARPFETHHNALNMPLFLRIAPELFLKRLVVGGFEKVYEINRNFRNEGISTRHNPEFTMIEFYQAYATYQDMMQITQTLLQVLAEAVLDSTVITCQGQEIDLSQPFPQIPLRSAILQFNPGVQSEQVDDPVKARALLEEQGVSVSAADGLGKIQMALFEKLVEKQLHQPTFITEFPREVSPLARANDDNPFITDRFEFYAGGQEIANGFSELNDPEDQAERFAAQVKAQAAGDDEAMGFDHDYIKALEYGLPPTAGQGIGIDRLVMFLTGHSSIRDVILFPLMRPKGDL